MNIEFKKEDENQVIKVSKVQKTCGICHKSEGSYSCPRCNVSYCGLKCYQDPGKHLKCSEDFYQDQVITELKMCKLEDKSDKEKMVEILKKVSKEFEKEKILPGDDSYSDSSSDSAEETENVDDNKLINAYETEIVNWKPWWHSFKEMKLKELDHVDKEFRANANLIRRSMKVNVDNANPLLLNDIMSFFYTYAILAYIYQLEVNNLDENNNLDEEFVINFVKIDKILKSRLPKGSSNLGSVINLAIKSLLNEQDAFLKEYLTEEFLTGLIDEVIFVNESPSVLLKILSSFYELCETFLKSRKTQVLKQEHDERQPETTQEATEQPLNVFHYNKQTTEKNNTNTQKLLKTPRVQIISSIKKKEIADIRKPVIKVKDLPVNKNDITKEIRSLLKRIEFYFKWLNRKQEFIKEPERSKLMSNELELIKEALNNDLDQFQNEKQFIDRNITKIRQNNLDGKKVMIEEI